MTGFGQRVSRAREFPAFLSAVVRLTLFVPMHFPSAISLLFFVATTLSAQVLDPSMDTGRKLAPFVLALKPSIQMSPLPPWMPAPATVRPETATIEVPIPALWEVPSVEFYVLTVVFDDRGDGGPAIEWHGAGGMASTISPGLGETGVSLGLNARTILLPKNLTREGGVLLVSYYGKFEGLLSVAVRPAREDLLAVLGAQADPALVDEALRVYESRDVNGLRSAPITGDVRRGAVVEAELAADVEEVSGELEFIIPISGEVEATMLRLDVLGLDLEAKLEVRVNGIEIGDVGFAAFRLDDPAVVPDGLDRPIVAGWRDGALFIPARFWLPGENSLVITHKRSPLESGRPLFLRNSHLHIRFGGSEPEPLESEFPSEPDLTLPDLLIPDPSTAPLPEIVTGYR